MSIKLKKINPPKGTVNLCAKKVCCVYCWEEEMSAVVLAEKHYGYFQAQCECAGCGACSPIADGRTCTEAITNAYAEALASSAELAAAVEVARARREGALDE